jgi:hypothetical protein
MIYDQRKRRTAMDMGATVTVFRGKSQINYGLRITAVIRN